FNRFCALRFMDVNGYNRVGVVSPTEGQVQPEILAEAKSGIIDEDQISPQAADKVCGLLNGSIPSPDAQSEAYRLLVVGSCNALYKRMPYLFERIQDFTELLMPDDLLSDNSILTKMRAVMTPESCEDVEIIGWLYQFYISEKKDQVFAALKKNQKITAENIPAATQLFTPHWIVRYLVENSLGRLWMLNRPNSKLTEQMEYYIAPEEPETDFLKISSPEELRVADPAAGSGHMLTYAFDLLYAIYEEEGYDPNDIPGLILSNNLYGIEIDERAGALASFALEMKAAAKLGRRRFFRMDAKPNVCVLEDVSFTDSEMDDVMSIVGKDLYSADLRETLTQFEQAKNFGSLIVPKLKVPAETLRLTETKDLAADMWLTEVHERVVKVLRMADYLSTKYHVVVANPPYMGGKGMNGNLSVFAKKTYPDSKSDLFAMFIERGMRLIPKLGYSAMVTMQSWMFLSSYEKLRVNLKAQASIDCMAHMANMVMGIAFGTSATVWQKGGSSSKYGGYCYVEYENIGEDNRPVDFPPSNERNLKAPDSRIYRASAEDFGKIPGSPISYWVDGSAISSYGWNKTVEHDFELIQGMITGDNDRVLRYWFEILSRNFSEYTNKRNHWVPYNKGGEARKWYGNHDLVIDWRDQGKSFTRSRSTNSHLYFRAYASWSYLNSGEPAARYYPEGFLWDVHGSGAFPKTAGDEKRLVALLCSKVGSFLLSVTNPTMSFQVENIASLPWDLSKIDQFNPQLLYRLFEISKIDWDFRETSWYFTTLTLLSPDHRGKTLAMSYATLRTHWESMTDEMQHLEEKNNRIFIDAYGLQDELTPEVPIEEITLTCNPAYRYGIRGTEEEREAHLKADTMAEFLSYAVGCMFGRFSLDEPGLILANQGETLSDYLARIPEPTFIPDDDNVIPMIDFEGDWFEDDISERFKQFLRVTFGDKHYA
ncbi:BREX-1 system adenine-specific DNA-methyltransferase PglX, partial [uncultured Kiloniella sp.]|uniref:BREX-1 system adenine-specific DNA-methyltransferase PglX n=1 Tax=uncultured Kiloniella sp. TaxID=1133091 RepID=UPI00262FFF2C